MIATTPSPAEPKPAVDRLIEVRTPDGRPVAWAEVALVTDIGDSHELNDDRCLVITSQDLGERAPPPLRDFMLCLLADGATGSTFGPGAARNGTADAPRHAGWRASQIAQAVFVERFLSSHEADILDRLKDGLRAADRALVDSGEGSLSTTLTALFLSADGTACAASIGDSVLLVLPPKRRTPADRRVKKLGYEDTTSVGSGDTTLSYVEESDLIEQWWPNKEGGNATTRVAPGTYFVLMSDGIADNLPVDLIDQLLHRHALDRATLGLAVHTRELRVQAQKQGGGSTNQLGLDNMSAIAIRYDGVRRRPVGLPRPDDASLVCVLGSRGGPTPTAGGQFGLACLAGQEQGATAVPGFLSSFIESEHQSTMPDRLATAFLRALPKRNQASFSVLAVDEQGQSHTFSSGAADLSALAVRIAQRTVSAARETALQKFLYTPRLWASTLAGLGLCLLVSTAFATGTVRPAPPPAPTPAPGEPTPTPDTRPALSFGGFQLIAPAPAATPTPAAQAQAEPAAADLHAEALVPEDKSTEPPPPTPVTCTNPFGLLCGSPPPPARPAPPRTQPRTTVSQTAEPTPAQPSDPAPPQPAEAPATRVVPEPSPAPPVGSAETGPRPGSPLDHALKIASLANEQFNRSLEAETGR